MIKTNQKPITDTQKWEYNHTPKENNPTTRNEIYLSIINLNINELNAPIKRQEFCQENVLVMANTLFQQHKRRLYTWTSPDGQNWNQIDYILCSQRWRSSIQSAKTRPGADSGSDHKLLIPKFRLKLMKVRKKRKIWREYGKPLDHLGMT